ncbi:MAG: cytochrome o ubiquinol oxidase subunit [Candidatus Parcubacteria bacterium]
MEHHHTKETASIASYGIGFGLSLFLTVVPFFVVTQKVFATQHAVYLILLFAMAQLAVQVVYFLHLHARAARMHALSLAFTACMIWCIVVGSLWIMNNLEANMTHDEINAYMHKQN